MQILNLIKNTFTLNNLLPFFIKTIFCIMVILLLIGAIELILEKRKENRIKGLVKEQKLTNRIKNLKIVKRFAKNLEIVLKDKNKEYSYEIYFYGVILSSIVVMFGFILVKQIVLAILTPVIVLYIANELCLKLSADTTEQLEEQLPFAIDNIIRVSSKYSDMKSIIYEVSRTCSNPVRGIFEDMSREMLTNPADVVLTKYANKYDNIWFYSVTFTLISYLEDVSKEETMANLKHLRDILEKENFIKKTSLTEKKVNITTNYVLAGFGVLGFFGNLFINPGGKKFFFSTFPGLLCFIFGMGAIILTVFLNIEMSKAKKK